MISISLSSRSPCPIPTPPPVFECLFAISSIIANKHSFVHRNFGVNSVEICLMNLLKKLRPVLLNFLLLAAAACGPARIGVQLPAPTATAAPAGSNQAAPGGAVPDQGKHISLLNESPLQGMARSPRPALLHRPARRRSAGAPVAGYRLCGGDGHGRP